MRLLLIEDSKDLQTLYSIFLRKAGHIVDLAANAEDALLLTTINEYEAVISDINLPGLSGFDFLSLFKKLRANSNIPCLAITASGDRRAEAMRTGFSDFLEKPLFGKQLIERLEQLRLSRLVPGQKAD